ncbi:LacI family DNA-binding transcriptional regulator [Xenophilus aerolatus]|nr:LacI family DNA-binding transcriptional regulator [Xenophilus aerolatus]
MSIQKVARRAGVSVATVSRAFNLPDKVTPATRELVERVARELGYVPNASARTLRTQRSRVLGVVLPTLMNPTFAECLQGIAAAAAAQGYAIMPVTSGYRIDEEERAVGLLQGSNVDGFILVVANPSTSATLQRLAQAGTPYVLAYNRHAAHPCVGVDGEAAVADVVARLTLLGHRHIAMVSGTLSASDRAQQRYQGFLRGMDEAGFAPPPLIEVPFVEAASDVIARALSAPRRPTALVCSNDLLAIRSIRAAHLGGLSVPQALSVVGFDGIALGEDLMPALSTIAQPNIDIGKTSVELLTAALAQGQPLGPEDSVLLPHVFRDGESCAQAPGFA